jgi:hypothetical protein
MGSSTCPGNTLAEARQLERAITAHQDAAAIDPHGKAMALTTHSNALRQGGRFEAATTPSRTPPPASVRLVMSTGRASRCASSTRPGPATQRP